MAEFPARTPSPKDVHGHSARLLGFDPAWIWTRYHGGLYRMDHYRRCSWCGCIHPGDMMALLRAGRSSLRLCGKTFKRIFVTPNPVSGRPCRMGSMFLPVFNWELPPRNLHIRLTDRPSEADATIGERLTGHMERPLFRDGPEMIEQPFYLEHTTDAQWDEIISAAAFGERKREDDASLPCP